MTNICAAIGLAQLEQIDEILAKKRQVANWYKEAIKGSRFEFHLELKDVLHSYWMCTVLIPEGMEKQALKEFLMEHGIETRPMFYPIHTMPIYSQKYEKHQMAEALARRGITLPSYPSLSKENIDEIVAVMMQYENN
jgi:perosamine synthetase